MSKNPKNSIEKTELNVKGNCLLDCEIVKFLAAQYIVLHYGIIVLHIQM